MIRVLLADDEALIRTGIRLVLETADDIEIIAEAANESEAVTALQPHAAGLIASSISSAIRARTGSTRHGLLVTK